MEINSGIKSGIKSRIKSGVNNGINNGTSRGINSSQLKWIAAAAMLLDHVGKIYRQQFYGILRLLLRIWQGSGRLRPGDIARAWAGAQAHSNAVTWIDQDAWLYCIHGILFLLGRIAFPLFAFQAAGGIRHTRSPKRLMGRLLLFGLLAEIPFRWMVQTISGQHSPWPFTNVMFTLLLAVIACACHNRLLKQGLPPLYCLAPGFVLAMGAEWCRMDYGAAGVLLVLFLSLADTAKQKQAVLAAWCIVTYGVPLIDPGTYLVFAMPQFLGHLMRVLYALLGVWIIGTYNGQKGRSPKYFFYLFYPLHLWILMLLSLIS